MPPPSLYVSLPQKNFQKIFQKISDPFYFEVLKYYSPKKLVVFPQNFWYTKHNEDTKREICAN